VGNCPGLPDRRQIELDPCAALSGVIRSGHDERSIPGETAAVDRNPPACQCLFWNVEAPSNASSSRAGRVCKWINSARESKRDGCRSGGKFCYANDVISRRDGENPCGHVHDGV